MTAGAASLTGAGTLAAGGVTEFAVTTAGAGSWLCPPDVTAVTAECWGAGGGSGAADHTAGGAGGGGAGAYARKASIPVVPGTSYPYSVGAGGTAGTTSAGTSATAGGATTFSSGACAAAGGSPGAGAGSGTGGAGGTAAASTGDVKFPGGDGGDASSGLAGAGGGSSAGAAAAGNAGGASSGSTPGAAGTAVPGGGPGAAGSAPGANGTSPVTGPGGGAGGAGQAAIGFHTDPGGAGAPGQLRLSWVPSVPPSATLPGGGTLTAGGTSTGAAVLDGTGTLTALGGNPDGALLAAQGTLTAAAAVTYQAAASLAGAGTLTAAGGLPDAQIVNQWAASAAQPVVFGPSPPAGSSVAVPLAPSSSVGGGSGTPSAGSWLFAIAGWNEASASAGVTVSAGDDTHMWWRPAQPSPPAATRTVIWYQPNITDPPPATVYVTPSGYVDGMSVLVVEVAGLGNWDAVTGIAVSDAAAATSLALSLPAPPAPAFVLAAVTGDSATAGTALAGTGWTGLATVTASNGTDATGDAVLAAAAKSSSSAASITGTAHAAENLSGMILAVQAGAPDPRPPGINPLWPYVLFEAAFGSGYQTPPDQMEWVNLQSAEAGKRLRSWEETTGHQYELDALESSEVQALLDNPDAALSPFQPGSPWYPGVVPGTPVRIRAIPPGGSRWHVIQRNMERWPQTWAATLRGESNAVATDLWSVINKVNPAPYRAEVIADAPYAWWPCDDSGINGATSLVNAAPGNATPLQILTSPAGLNAAGEIPNNTGAPIATTYSAVQAFAADSGWMYGDPSSASWQQTGNGSPATGRYLWCHDPAFPKLSGGVTIEGWWNLAFPATGSGAQAGPIGQPAGTLVLWEIANATNPVAVLSLTAAGVLQLQTWHGTTQTTTALYGAAPGDGLLDNTWLGVTVTLTTSGWTAWVNGGILATLSWAGAITPAWQYFLGGASTGGAGGGVASVTGLPNAKHSHLAVYPSALPAGRVVAHSVAAYTAFGQLPAPALDVQFVAVPFSGGLGNVGYAPDGRIYSGTYTAGASVAALVTAAAGAYHSAPCSPEASGVFNSNTSEAFGWITATGLAPSYAFYTAAGAGNELQSSVTPQSYQYVQSYGTGAAPPAAASALGDSVRDRIERLLASGGVTTPARCIDPDPAPVVAALDTGGQSSGSNITNIAQSGSGLLFMDGAGNLCYWDAAHLASQPVLWQLGPDIASGQIPYVLDGLGLDTDPQKVANDIEITQANVQASASSGNAGISTGSGEVAGGLVFAPDSSRFAAVQASQQRNGFSQLQFTSYLQDRAAIQAQANALFDAYGTPRQRITGLTVNAAGMARTCPAAWEFFFRVNVADVMQATFRPPGQPPFSGTWRITRIARKLDFAAGTASVTVTADAFGPTAPQPLAGIADEAGSAISDEAGSAIT